MEVVVVAERWWQITEYFWSVYASCSSREFDRLNNKRNVKEWQEMLLELGGEC